MEGKGDDVWIEWVKRRPLIGVIIAIGTVVGTAFALPVLVPIGIAYLVWQKAGKTQNEQKQTHKTSENKGIRVQLNSANEKVKKPTILSQVDSNTREISASAKIQGGPALLQRLKAQKAANGLHSQKNKEPVKNVIVAYASQTGTAQEIARALHTQLTSRLPDKVAQYKCFNDVDIDGLSKTRTPIIAFVAASTGDGDPPDNTASFYAKMLRKSNNAFEGIKYTCLGLGDSNYTRFMAVPRNMRKKFEALGAENMYWNAEADEVEGLEEIVDKWTEGTVKAILKEYNKATDKESNGIVANVSKIEDQSKDLPPLPCRRCTFKWSKDEKHIGEVRAQEQTSRVEHAVKEDGVYTVQEPFWAKIKCAERMTPDGYDKKVIHMQLDISGSNIKYKAGDAFGTLPKNDVELVHAIVKRLGLTGDEVFETSEKINSVKSPCSVSHALTYHCDITTPPKKSFLRILAEACTAAEDKEKVLEMLRPTGKALYKDMISKDQPGLLDLLRELPSCKPSIEDLIEFLPPLAPRLYSLSSAREMHPEEMHFAFSVVKYETKPNRFRQGVATTWLSELTDKVREGSSVYIPVYLRPSKDFVHPQEFDKPMMMIGPGTGVAPFRGFLQYRNALRNTITDMAETWLFFGCRDRNKDFLYKSDLMEMKENGVLGNLETAFSREQENKVYVQHKMQANSEKLGELIVDRGGYIFVCGDGMHMAKDVHKCLQEIVSKKKGIGMEEANTFLRSLQDQGKYVKDIWS